MLLHCKVFCPDLPDFEIVHYLETARRSPSTTVFSEAGWLSASINLAILQD